MHIAVASAVSSIDAMSVRPLCCSSAVVRGLIPNMRGVSVTDGGPLNSASKTPCFYSRCLLIEIECLLYDSHQQGKMMIMITKTSGSRVDSTVAEGKRKEGGGRKMRDLHKDT